MLFAVALCIGVYNADAAVRTANSPNRNNNTTSTQKSLTSRSATQQTVNSSREKDSNTSARSAVTPRKDTTVSRTSSTARVATAPRTTKNNVARTATNVSRSARVSTARAGTITTATSTFGGGYNLCRDAYFTCMDQFCANQNESYRRCSCSSKLTEVKSRENALKQTANQLQDFKDLNLEAIPKTGAEVTAMLTAAEGEAIAATIRDTSEAAQKLAGISAVLSNSKSQSLSTLGTLDIAGDINQIWATTDLASGVNIANLYGEALYNAVHSQCKELVASNCESTSTLNMVISAYGMYIENDCAVLISALDKKFNAAHGTIRETEREMNSARLDNYDAHNSTSINDCIALVRKDITADTACGANYVHCLDVTGRYLTYATGEPIYSPEFYQLESQISLSGDVLTNSTNRTLVAELNRKREFAANSLETCRDLADDVWDAFMRQTITEIYQQQQAKVREVKTECLDVVNTCYDEQSKSLKDFSNVKEQLLLGARLELSEEMCQEKLYACANLYGEGGTGLNLLVDAMHNITDQKIANNCRVTLQEYAQAMCTVPSNDTIHAYPYGCRVYTPGSEKHANDPDCNQQIWDNTPSTTSTASTFSLNSPATASIGYEIANTPMTMADSGSGYTCSTKKYTSCIKGYYMATMNSNGQWVYNGSPTAGNSCQKCPGAYVCDGGTKSPYLAQQEDENTWINPEYEDVSTPSKCEDYPGSLYQKLVRYAMQNCVRPSETSAADYVLPVSILQDVNSVMDSVRSDMGKALDAECERLGGIWVSTRWVDKTGGGDSKDKPDGTHDSTGDTQYKQFYDETGSNTQWGFCATVTE